MFGPTRAPEIDRAGLSWFNTDKPLSIKALAGRLVILDFWTFCCINCMHILPILRRVEEAFPDEVAVIGVHSPKFAAERKAANVAQAIARYDVRHPVVHDPYMSIWQDYAVRAWPTLAFVSPDGRVIGQTSGEPSPQALLAGVEEMLRQFREEGSVRPGIPLLAEPERPASRLLFPGKIKSAGKGQWLVADAGHHQIVQFDDQGTELARYGSGEAGLMDGDAASARFSSPQGLAADDRFIWVADTGNHALRRIERTSGHVITIAGDGSRGPILHGSVPAQSVALASPWDVELVDGHVFIANAGTHQLAVYDPASDHLAVAAGTGGENLRDGAAAHALLAQPSGLARHGDGLYFADSETSSIRRLDLISGEVETLVGQGLFDFGAEDGPFDEALLQHALGVAVESDGSVLVADSYNGLIRRLDPSRRTASTIDLGDCADDLCLPLAEPAGIAVVGPGRLLLSDTNNHRILEIDLKAKSYRSWPS